MRTTSAPTLRTYIVDDETRARRRLRQLLDGCASPRVEVRGEAGNARALCGVLEALEVDLLFLDVELPGLGGLAAVARLTPDTRPPALVFVTEHTGHALQAYELGAIDYLCKPVTRERLQRTLDRAEAMVRAASRLAAPAPGLAGGVAVATGERSAAPGTSPGPVLQVHARDRDERLPLHEVLYVRAELKYLTVRTARRQHLMSGSLDDLESRYGDHFVRIHRNALVARWALSALVREPAGPCASPTGRPATPASWRVQLMALDETLPISRRQLPAVRAALAGTPGASPC